MLVAVLTALRNVSVPLAAKNKQLLTEYRERTRMRPFFDLSVAVLVQPARAFYRISA